MIFGLLQRRWQEEKPAVYDKETRTVCLDIVKDNITTDEGEKEGYSFIPVEIDSQIDYGHIKSQLIEAGFAQKDEFGLLMNAVDGILTAVSKSESWKAFKQNLDTEDIKAFSDFCAFRKMCAEAAKEILKSY
ncbi:MAG: hypothetical protein IJ640_09340 [Prevotella sp.]|nr:hypothetical protein [Prevotella sp.]